MTQGSEHPERTLLLAAYWFPPAVGAAAERAWALARYLPRHSWRCHVWTARRDRPLPNAEGATVHEVPDRLARQGPMFGDYDPRTRPSRLRGCLRELVFPDRFVFWQRSALTAARDFSRDHPTDLILASFPPASAVALGLNLSRETGVPLVLDFRDRWLGPGGYEPIFDCTRRKHARREQEAIAHSAAIITVSDALADAVAREHGFDRRRIFVIPNGYEPEDADTAISPALDSTAAQSSTGRLTIAHVGTVIPRNRPDLLFRALTSLIARGGLSDVIFNFVGNLSRDYVASAGLAQVVQATGLVSRSEALAEMRRASALLLLTGSYVGQWGYNAKLFEYIRAGRPILCLEETPGSNDRRLLEQFARERSFFASVGDPDAIARAVADIRLYLADSPRPAATSDEAFAAYSRPSLVARLAAALDAVLAPKAP